MLLIPMPWVSEFQTFVSWLIDAYGAVSSILVCVVIYQAYQLRQEQKEAREMRLENALAQQKMVESQLSAVTALHELKNALTVVLHQKGK